LATDLPNLRQRGVLGRADLLRLLQHTAVMELVLSDSLVFQRILPTPPRYEMPLSLFDDLPVSGPAQAPEDDILQLPNLWAVTRFEKNAAQEPEPSDATTSPNTFPAMPARVAFDVSQAAADTAMQCGLVQSWPGLSKQLRAALSPARAGRALDVARLVQRVAAGQTLAPLPRKCSRRWPGGVVIALDPDSESLSPLSTWQFQLAQRLRRAIGDSAVTLRIWPSVRNNSDNVATARSQFHTVKQDGARAPSQRWAPLFGQPLLLLSDLGASHPEHAEIWAHWLHSMRHGGTQITVLSPSAGAMDIPALPALLSMLRAFGRVREPLLNALAALLLPAAGVGLTQLIWAAWNHPAVRRDRNSCWLDPEHAETLVAEARLPQLSTELLHAALARAIALNAGDSDIEFKLLALRLHTLLPQLRHQSWLEAAYESAKYFIEDVLPAQFANATNTTRARLDLLATNIVNAAPASVRGAHQRALQWLYQHSQAASLAAGQSTAVLPGLPIAAPAQLPGPERDWLLRQIGTCVELVLSEAEQLSKIRLGTELARGWRMPVGQPIWVKIDQQIRQFPSDSGKVVIELPERGEVELLGPEQRLSLEWLQRPSWASAWGYVAGKLKLWFKASNGNEVALPWPGAPFSFGADEFGVFADLKIKQATQRFRYIEPGEFLMGSPATEVERENDEGPQHRVRITQGFWLADSACTEAFWLAVMGGENPSHFKADLNCPVERVSFGDIEGFLSHLNALLPSDFAAGLPTEAQWEYACRAGTQTPFHFGANITPEQVNYDANHPYANGKKGIYRKRTVPVKSLPPNAWGLYETHGNVWEWCADDSRKYDALEAGQAELDPRGSDQSSARALRGGSWIDFARGVRAAFRYRYERDLRYGGVGFRLFLRSLSPRSKNMT
jgi:formylglycine-generating enzyme